MKIKEQEPFNQGLFLGKVSCFNNLCALGTFHNAWHLSTQLIVAEYQISVSVYKQLKANLSDNFLVNLRKRNIEDFLGSELSSSSSHISSCKGDGRRLQQQFHKQGRHVCHVVVPYIDP